MGIFRRSPSFGGRRGSPEAAMGLLTNQFIDQLFAGTRDMPQTDVLVP
jgi:hypothetical protein